MNFITVLGDPETVTHTITCIVKNGGTILDFKKTQFKSTYLIGYSEGVAVGCFLLLEDGSKIALEKTGVPGCPGFLTIEICINYLIMEDGSFLLLEDGSRILTEEQE